MSKYELFKIIGKIKEKCLFCVGNLSWKWIVETKINRNITLKYIINKKKIELRRTK